MDNELSIRWRDQGLEYVTALNAFVERGMRDGWDKAGEAPREPRGILAEAVLTEIREANRIGDTAPLREAFPPAYEPFIQIIKEKSHPVAPLLLSDGRIVAQVGTPHERESLLFLLIEADGTFTPLPSVWAIGRSPDRRYFAIADPQGVTVRDGWDGPVAAQLSWPTGQEGIPDGFTVPTWEAVPPVEQLIPFPDGRRVLLVTQQGIFVLAESGAIRLYPDTDSLRERLQESQPDEGQMIDLSMIHGAISPDGSLIALGHQDSRHLIYRGDDYRLIAQVGPHGEYPHYALFSAEGSHVAFNACHFYNGGTICIAVKDLPGLETEYYAEDSRITLIDEEARVYAGVARDDAFLLGDAYGYVQGCGIADGMRWRHFVGGNICGMDISPDGKRLLVGTYTGILSMIDLDTGTPDPFTIGTATHREVRRYLFWGEPGEVLLW